ncbi:MAG: ATP-binding protein [bacterium]
MKRKVNFKARARLLLQLGEQLIKNEKIAMLELVKNAYDADSSRVDIIMEKVDDKENACLIVEDDGIGMDFSVIKNEWMEPGSDYKEKKYKKGERTKKFRRLPLGEKGIGRFAAHKLGNKIELITRKKNEPEYVVNINWEDFGKNNYRYLDDVPITIDERKPIVFTKEKHGTQITISSFRREWRRGEIRELHRSINSLCSPFGSEDPFHINFELTDNEDWLDDLFTWEYAKQAALWYFKCVLENDRIKKLHYEFRPWKSMSRLEKKIITEKKPDIHKKLILRDPDDKKGQKVVDISKLGKIGFEGYIYDNDTRVLKLGLQDIKGLKNYLKENSGIRIYRDGIRIFDYGEKGNDWLNLDLRRVNNPTRNISKNLIISAIEIDRDSSSLLREKTNREGFIEDENFVLFSKAIEYNLHVIESLRLIDKRIMKKLYAPSEKTEPVLATIAELRNITQKSIEKDELKNIILECVDRIEKDYSELNERLLRSAGAGLSLAIVVHEFEKIVSNLRVCVSDENIGARIKDLVKHLSILIEGYSLLLRNKKREPTSLKKVIRQAIFNMEYRLEIHEITPINKAKEADIEDAIKLSKPLITSSIMNIIDNSIYWLDFYDIKTKKIYFDIQLFIDGYITLIIADNGHGFSLPREHITAPYITDKQNGMGLGLHIADEIMKEHGGSVTFPDFADVKLPEEYKDGAIICLNFREDEIDV